jgi:DNA-binding transcriptional ArsR family regulator
VKCVGPTLAPGEIEGIRRSLEFAPELDETAELFNLASNSTRLKILFLLDRLRELCVCDLAEMLGVSVSAVSQHLAKLRAYGLATTRREAQTIYYRLAHHPFLGKLRSDFLREIEWEPLDAPPETDKLMTRRRAPISGALLLVVLAGWGARVASPAEPTSDLTLAPARLTLEAGVAAVPVAFSGGRPVVEVEIDGAGPYPLVLDTGGVGLMIEADLADELHLPIVGESRVSSPLGSSGGVEVRQGQIERLTLGTAVLESLRVDLWNGAPLFPGTNPPRGIFGITLLREALVTLDLSSGRLLLERGTLPETGAGIVDVESDQGLPVIPLDVAGTVLWAHLDSGNPGLLHLPLERRGEFPLRSPPIPTGRARTVDAELTVYSATLSGSVHLGGVRFDNLEILLIEGTPWANVGVDLLRRFVIVLDQRRMRARFESAEQPKAPDRTRIEETVDGARCERDDQGWLIDLHRLTLTPTPHRLLIGDQILLAYCTLRCQVRHFISRACAEEFAAGSQTCHVVELAELQEASGWLHEATWMATRA